jgi:rhodanese-related sulfurtransferase
MSTKVAGLAIKDGYTNVKVYLEGQPAWIKGGNLVYASNGNVEKGNIVLIDLRSKEKAMAGRIARSVSIPYESLDDRYEDIPIKAPIVLYSDSQQEVADAYEEFRDEGFKKVALVSGNYDGWLRSGGKIEQGAVVSDINWVRKLGKGEVSKTDFLKVASGADTTGVILDIRTADEAGSGGFKNAIAIPLDKITARMSEIPKDKKVYVHCTTGARAEMAAQELNNQGYKAFFLVANVECDGNECEIED